MGMITITEYAEKYGLSPDSVRKKALRGGFQTAKKSGKVWLIDENEPNTDNRVKTGEYIGFRKKINKKL